MRWQNMDQCECDRCGRKEILKPDSPNQADWHDEQRITGEGVEQRFLLCTECHNKYKERMTVADTEFNKWRKGGR